MGNKPKCKIIRKFAVILLTLLTSNFFEYILQKEMILSKLEKGYLFMLIFICIEHLTKD